MAYLLKSSDLLSRAVWTKTTGKCSQIVRFKGRRTSVNYVSCLWFEICDFAICHFLQLPNYNKTNPVDLTLAHFDNFYSKIYRKYWQSVRLGLLSPNKYAALINYYANSDDIQVSLRQNGAYNIQYIYEKNLTRILRFIEKRKFIQARRIAMLGESEEAQSLKKSP